MAITNLLLWRDLDSDSVLVSYYPEGVIPEDPAITPWEDYHQEFIGLWTDEDDKIQELRTYIIIELDQVWTNAEWKAACDAKWAEIGE